MSVKSFVNKDHLTLILDNGDYTEFIKALEKWNFKDHQSLLRFAISLLALNENDHFPLDFFRNSFIVTQNYKFQRSD